MTASFTCTPQIDRTSARWITCVHEAAHAVVGDAQGGKVDKCVVHDDDVNGSTIVDISHPVKSAVVALAAREAVALICGQRREFLARTCATDEAYAEEKLAATRVSFDQAGDKAAALVDECRDLIEDVAAVLYRDGCL